MTITALTYNISWANQKGLVEGSEADFVAMCQKTNTECFRNCLKIIKEVRNLHLVGLQEVNTENLEEEIISSSEHLNSHERGTVGLSSVSLIWNDAIFGEVVGRNVVNLSKKEDDRPCLIVSTTHGYQLICAHFPWIDDVNQVTAISKILEDACFSQVAPTIILADTNDENTLISKDAPLCFGGNVLSQGLTKAELEANLISCCWHETEHTYRSFVATGDYILAPDSIMGKNYILEEHNDILASDHRPVLADLKLPVEKALIASNNQIMNQSVLMCIRCSQQQRDL